MSGKLQGIKSSPLVMPGPLLVSLLGLAFCASFALDNSIDICLTAGCELNENASLWGLSLWWYGAFAFCVLTVLSLSGRAWLGIAAAGFCVFLDLWLFILMLTTAPCTSCLVVGGFFVLTYLAFRRAGRGLDPLPRSMLVTVWLVLFVANVGTVIQDSPKTWSIVGPENSSINVFFSPSCTHCRTAIEALVNNKEAAFFPITEKEGDFDAVANMLSYMIAGDDILTALQKAQKPQENTLGFFENVYLYFQLSRNKAKVLKAGSHVVPFIEYKGLPAALAKPKPPQNIDEEPMETIESMDPINLQNNDANLPIDTGVAGSCGGEQATPCPDAEINTN